MGKTKQMANEFREVFLNGRWIAGTNISAEIKDLTFEEATEKIHGLNTISALVQHLHYYIEGIIQVFEGGSLDIRDKYSFDFQPIQSKNDWQQRLAKIWANAEKFANLIEQMPDERLAADFADEKYGTYERNILGMIEHCYYHMGQMVLIKKMIRNK